MISVIVFAILATASTALFALNAKRIRRNILLGRDLDLSDNKGQRFGTMLRVAFGQSKMTTRPVAAVMHLFVYVGFVLINVEVLEMFVDGLFRTHRAFAFLGSLYNAMIGFFEILAFLVTLGCAVFLIRRNIVKVKRFLNKELDGWPRNDANIILCSEIILMSALFIMNAADQILQSRGSEHYLVAGCFPFSPFVVPVLIGCCDSCLN